MADTRWRPVGGFTDRAHAQFALERLRSEGIDGRVIAPGSPATEPRSDVMTGSVRLLVREDDAEAAHAVLDDMSTRDGDLSTRPIRTRAVLGRHGLTVAVLLAATALVLATIVGTM